MNLHKRLICVLTGLACVALLASCTPHGANTQSVTITEAGNASDLIGPPIQTDTGWDVAIPDSTTTARDNCEATDWPVTYLESPNNENGSASSEAAKPESTLVSLNPQDGSVRWARTIKPAMRTHTFGGNSNTPQSLFLRSQQCAIAALVSNERYLAFYLRPWMASEGSSSIGDQRMNIVVLNAATGNEVRTIEVSGLVLGQAIVNDSLVVETAQNYYPGGTGILNVFSLTDPHAEPTTTRTDNWLIGSTNDSLLMSPQNSLMRLPNLDSYLISTIIRTTVAGEELETITGVTAIHPNSWIERAKNPQEAAETAASPDKTPLAALPRDLINIDSGASVDVTGQYVTSVNLPTGPGLLLRTVTTTGEGEEKKTTYINHSWLPATSDSTEPRADDMQQIDLDNKANKVFSKPIRMGEEEK
jgi:hypothetical protein avisC_03246